MVQLEVRWTVYNRTLVALLDPMFIDTNVLLYVHFWNALYIYIPSGAKGSDGRAAMAAGDVINWLMMS